MNQDTLVRRVGDEDFSYVFAVSVGQYSYKVSASKDYCQKLTGGRITPEELIKKSFEFLLEREGPTSILREFALPQIQHYFPEYEQTIRTAI